MKNAIEFAKVLMSKGIDDRYTNTKDGNLVINKMLYFAQLVSLAKYEEKLFDSNIYAFENGSVVEDVRQKYKNNYNDLKTESNLLDLNKLSIKEKDVIEETIKLFSSFSAEELSEITHGHTTWVESFEGSKVGNFYMQDKQLMSIGSLMKNEVPWIKQFLMEENEDNYPYIVNNNILFYYNPLNYTEEEVIDLTNNFKGEEDVYTVVKEDDGKAVIY